MLIIHRAVGSVQDYISSHQLSEYKIRDVGWIIAVLVFLTLFLGVQVGPLFDRYGPRYLLICGATLSIISFFTLAQCREYWHFMLCLSICGGVGSAIITTISLAVLSHWFHRRRALASGICMGGSSFGGMMFPLLLRKLFPKYGWTWSIRIIGVMSIACYILGIMLVKSRLPRNRTAAPKLVVDLGVFASARLTFLTIAVFTFEFVVFGCGALLPTYVRYAGFSTDTQFYSLSVLNGLSFLGRTLPGFAADMFGRFNMLMFLIVITLTTMAAVWLPYGSRSETALYAVVALFGFGSGGWLSLAPVCAGQLCRTEEYGRFYGSMYCIAAFGVLTTVPIGGELLQSTTPQVLVGFYSAILLAGLVSIIASRWAILDWKWKWKIKV
jgi:MFS family permease